MMVWPLEKTIAYLEFEISFGILPSTSAAQYVPQEQIPKESHSYPFQKLDDTPFSTCYDGNNSNFKQYLILQKMTSN